MNDVQTPQNHLFSPENPTNFGPGEPGTQATACHPPANDETPSIDKSRSSVLDLPFQDMARLGPGARCRQARNRYFLASDGF